MIQTVKASSQFSQFSLFFLPQHDVFWLEKLRLHKTRYLASINPTAFKQALFFLMCPAFFFGLSWWWEKHLWKQLEMPFVWSKLECSGDIQLRTGESHGQTGCRWICHYWPKRLQIKNKDWLDSVHPLALCYLATSPHFSVKSSSSFIP